MWHASISYQRKPLGLWGRVVRRAAKVRLKRVLMRVGEGGLIWTTQRGKLKITIQARRRVTKAEMRRLPQDRLPNTWTQEQEGQVRLWRVGYENDRRHQGVPRRGV